jgi:hypothetical protein
MKVQRGETWPRLRSELHRGLTAVISGRGSRRGQAQPAPRAVAQVAAPGHAKTTGPVLGYGVLALPDVRKIIQAG